MKEGLIEEEEKDDLKKAFNNYIKIVINISNHYKKIKDNDGESNNISKKKIINDIEKYKKYLDKLLNEKKNSNNSRVKKIIDDDLKKNKEEVEKYIEEIQNELKQKEVDMRVEDIIGEENDEKEGNLQQQPQVESDLINTNEFLEKRGEELNEINKVSVLIKETTGMMREQVNQQGETINRIEKNVDQTKENVDQANVEINKANELSKGNNKRISYIVGITVIAVGLVLALVIWSLN